MMSLGRFVFQMALRAEREENVGLRDNAWRRQYFRLIKSEDNHHPQEMSVEPQSDFKSRRKEVILGFLSSTIPNEPADTLDLEAQNLSRLFTTWKEANPNDCIRRSINYSDLERTSLSLLLIAQSAKFDAEDPLDLELADGLLTHYFRVARIVRTAHKLAQLQTASSF